MVESRSRVGRRRKCNIIEEPVKVRMRIYYPNPGERATGARKENENTEEVRGIDWRLMWVDKTFA